MLAAGQLNRGARVDSRPVSTSSVAGIVVASEIPVNWCISWESLTGCTGLAIAGLNGEKANLFGVGSTPKLDELRECGIRAMAGRSRSPSSARARPGAKTPADKVSWWKGPPDTWCHTGL